MPHKSGKSNYVSRPGHMKPKGARGRAQVKKLGRNFKTGGFKKIAAKAAKRYGSKAAGNRVAGAIFQKMVRAHRAGHKMGY